MNKPRGELTVRVLLTAAGIASIGYGVARILEQSGHTHPARLGVWMVAALLAPDVLVIPVVIGVGAALTRFGPSRLRAHVQGGLIAAGLVSVLGVLLINREGRTAKPSLTLLEQNYRLNPLILVAVIAAVSAGGYAVSVYRPNRRRARSTADR